MSFDDERLTDLFSDVGPVRKAFFVRQKGSDAHKGIAFVSFALAADAQKAVAELQGHQLQGQAIQVRPCLSRTCGGGAIAAAACVHNLGHIHEPDACHAARLAYPDVVEPNVSALRQHGCVQVELAKKRKSLEERTAQRRTAGVTEFVSKRKRADTSAAALDVPDVDAHSGEDALEATVPAGNVMAAKRHANAGNAATAAATHVPDAIDAAAGGAASDRLTSAEKAALCNVVAIGNSPPTALREVTKLARACGKVVTIETAVPANVAAFAKLQQDGCTEDAILVHFETGKEAFEAVWKLHGQFVGPGKKGRKELWARQVNGEGASVRTRLCAASLQLHHL